MYKPTTRKPFSRRPITHSAIDVWGPGSPIRTFSNLFTSDFPVERQAELTVNITLPQITYGRQECILTLFTFMIRLQFVPRRRCRMVLEQPVTECTTERLNLDREFISHFAFFRLTSGRVQSFSYEGPPTLIFLNSLKAL